MASRRRDRIYSNSDYATNLPNSTWIPSLASPATGTPAYPSTETNSTGSYSPHGRNNHLSPPGALHTGLLQEASIPRGHGNSGNPFDDYYAGYDPRLNFSASHNVSSSTSTMESTYRDSGQYPQPAQHSWVPRNVDQMPLSSPPTSLPRSNMNTIGDHSQISPGSSDRKEPCPECGRRIFHRGLRRHIEQIHRTPQGSRTKAIPRTPYNGGSFPCDECLSSYATERHLRDHQKRVHRPDSAYNQLLRPVEGGMPCPRGCSKLFDNKKSLSQHMRNVHQKGSGKV